MKPLYLITLMAVVLLVFSGTAAAQKKTTKKPVAKKPTTTAKSTVPPLDVRAAHEKTQIQLDDLNAFIDKYGPLAQNMETADADAKAGKLSSATVVKVEAAKTKLVQSVRDVKTGLSSLESEFRTKAALKVYLPSIQGIADLAAQSEDAVIAGKFVAAKDPLREVVKKLTDTLASLPK